MKKGFPITTTCLIGAGLLALPIFLNIGQNDLLAQSAPDPAHAAHVAAANPSDGRSTEVQLAEMLARVQQLQALAQPQHGQSPPGNAMPTDAGNPPRLRPMPGMDMAGNGKGGMGVDPAVADQMAELRTKMQRLEAAIRRQSGPSSGAMPMIGRGPGTMPASGGMGDMGAMMEKMMGGMGRGAMPPGGPMAGAAPGGGMGMGKMQNEMGAMDGGAMPGGPGMSGGGGGMGMMDMDKMEMAGMMGGMGGQASPGMAMPSALPGFPGASHLYHIGATGFFLDHARHLALSLDQRKKLNQLKEKAKLDKASTRRSVDQDEQDLWLLTAADEPDNVQIEAKISEIEKLNGDVRLRFIGAIGNAARILNDEQRKILTGFAPPTPAAAPMAGGMKDM